MEIRRRDRGADARVVGLAMAIFLGAGIISTWPALRSASSAFLAEGLAARGATAPGDHLQSVYRLWLPGHQLEQGEPPWVDPYSFQPEAEPQTNFAAWPFALPFWPLHRLLGAVGAWNAFVLLGYALAGGLAFAWLRSLGLGRAPALAGALAFALAPYRAAQTAAGHMLAPVSALLPGVLWAIERRRLVVAGAVLASIPLSGQVHLALGAIPFVLLYAGLRGRLWPYGAVAAGAGVAAGAVVWAFSIRDSLGAGGRSFAQVERYSAELADLVSRDVRHGIESFALLGWLLPALALAGAALLLVENRRRLALVLGLGAVVPIAAALGSNTPLYEPLWRHLPGLRETRVPERLLPIACLCLAALAAFAIERLRWRALAALAVVAVVLDLRAGVELFRATPAEVENAAYAALAERPGGRVVELPVFLPDRQEGSVYLLHTLQAPRERPLGYATTAPPEADALARRLRRRPCDERLLRELGVGYVVLHPGAPRCARRWPVIARAGTLTLRRIR